MHATHLTQERWIRLSRRHLWFALTLLLVAGAAALGRLAFPGPASAALSQYAFGLLPVFIGIGVAALRPPSRAEGGSAAMQAVVNDELRQASLHRAWRNGFIAALALQALPLLLPLWLDFANPAASGAVATILGAIAVFIASLLYYDR